MKKKGVKKIGRGKRPPRKVNSKRKAREFTRAYGSKARVEWVKSLPCVVWWCILKPSENAHVVSGGMGRKADAALVIPMCAAHHRELHRIGAATFQREFQIHLVAKAHVTEQRWQEHQRGAAA